MRNPSTGPSGHLLPSGEGRLLLVLIALCGTLAGQNAVPPVPQEPATVEGTVMKQGTMEPIPGVVVKFISEARTGSQATSDAAGKFTVSVRPGHYRVSSVLTGFVRPRRSAGPANLTLTAGQKLKNVQLQLVATSVITGRVLDANGRPIDHAMVAAIRPQFESGIQVLAPCNSANVATSDEKPLFSNKSATTDETGTYRIFGLDPGEYFLTVSGDPHGSSCADQYYPNAIDPADAIPVDAKSGEEIGGIDFRVTPKVLYTARFKIEEPLIFPDTTFRMFQITRRSRNSIESRDTWARGVQRIGDFYNTPGLPAGSYDLYYSKLSGVLAKFTFEIIDRDIDAGTLVVHPFISIPGHLSTSDGVPTAASDSQDYVIRLRAIDGRDWISAVHVQLFSISKVAPDGSFVITTLPRGPAPGSGGTFATVGVGLYQIEVEGLPPGAYVASAKYGGREVLGAGLEIASDPPASLEITIAESGAVVKGTVLNAKNEPVGDSQVVLIPPTDRRRSPNQFRTVVTDQNGKFSISGVPPGNYGILAWEDVEPNAWTYPDFLKDFETRATEIAVIDNGRTDSTIRVIPGN